MAVGRIHGQRKVSDLMILLEPLLAEEDPADARSDGLPLQSEMEAAERAIRSKDLAMPAHRTHCRLLEDSPNRRSSRRAGPP